MQMFGWIIKFRRQDVRLFFFWSWKTKLLWLKHDYNRCLMLNSNSFKLIFFYSKWLLSFCQAKWRHSLWLLYFIIILFCWFNQYGFGNYILFTVILIIYVSVCFQVFFLLYSWKWFSLLLTIMYCMSVYFSYLWWKIESFMDVNACNFNSFL